jgi:DNA-binding MarR family transcriptional regulator
MNDIYSSTMAAPNDALSLWELRILSSVRKEVKSEKKIAKDIGLNTLTTSQLITALISKNYIERTVRKGRIRRYHYTEKFAITQEGLTMLEEFSRHDGPWNQLTELLRQESNELPLKMAIGAVRVAFRLTKFVLKS